ncbi:rust resistance kinase Lr10-like [Prosopis cineraria]|uniref:rust resistance kinase Lr10-like n=1 Tax=Prosopis cineraria TaxID=364024 RepID=UPI0024104FCC|nr:rust resistance kinase Lr10-like [Prosopis cineraria]
MNMEPSLISRRRNWSEVVASIFVIITVLEFFPQIDAVCSPSCGKITNISYPFRLKGDPKHCGDKNFELQCISGNGRDDVLGLRILSGEFYVLSINYTVSSIRLVDPNFYDDHRSNNCSSLPRYFLYGGNFSGSDFSLRLRDFNYEVMYMKCDRALRDNPYYVDTDPCFLGSHIYAVPGNISLADLKIGCHVIAVTPSSIPDDEFLKLRYVDIHRNLQVFGFEISWDSVINRCPHTPLNADQCEMAIYCLGQALATLCSILNGIYFVITLRSPAIFRSRTSRLNPPLKDAPEYYIDETMLYTWYVVVFLLAVRALFGVTLLTALLIFKRRKRHLSMYEDVEHFLQHSDLMPIRYSYKEIKNMTKGFKDKLGEGGFGTVYKGKLRSGPLVAVKLLGKFKANGQEFISEVATIGRIHHVNVVRLIGFCVEGSKRALVYEFMVNGSLDKLIFPKEGSAFLSYEKIHQISLEVARGISYLHHGCDMQILHFDIKPHNILLDDNYIPKVSDFGLAKLYPRDDSSVALTAVKGTLGYMAPELFYKNIGGVSYKADVYSFGMLLMEMASRRRNTKSRTTKHSSENYFPLWLYDHFTQEKDIGIMEDLTREDKDIITKMFIVAWWCIQFKPVDRPSMTKVVEMLEANVESLEIPPKPVWYAQENIVASHGSNSDQASCSDCISSSYASDDF